jgi:DNA-binding SARP family transcriptional activator/tetratricopeptide (TPR) repeat protein
LLLRTFGGLALESNATEDPAPTLGPRRLALLAVVAAAGSRGITREKILGLLWAETEEESARHTLSQTLYSLRRDTGREWLKGTTQLRLDASIKSDIAEFQDALNAGDLVRAATLYSGPFLDGFYLPGAPEFEQWVEETRARLHFALRKSLETLVKRAADAGLHHEEINGWKRLCELDPFSATYAAGQMRALTAVGDLSAALQLANEYESRVRRELDAEPDPVINELIRQLRSSPKPAVASAAPMTVGAPLQSTTPTATIAIEPRTARSRRPLWLVGAIVMVLVSGVVAWRMRSSSSGSSSPFLAIGSIHSRDTAALGGVLRDMLATNLARVNGIQVVSNSRLLELVPRVEDITHIAVADAARRAGATEIIEGELGLTSDGWVLTLRRVSLRSGLVASGYSVRASDLYALTDSATAAIANGLQLDPPTDAAASVRTRSAIAYALYEQGLRSFYQGDHPAAIRLMTAALARDSSFAVAAFHAWRSTMALSRFDEANRLLLVVKRLATRTVGRERLWIDGMIAGIDAPLSQSLAIARELTDRYAEDPDGHILLGHALSGAGDWPGSIASFNRAVAIDSAAGATHGAYCRVCVAINGASLSYLWWDSASAAERTMRRMIALRSEDGGWWTGVAEPLLRLGRRADAEVAIARANKLSPIIQDLGGVLDRDLIRSGRLEELETRLVSGLRTAGPEARGHMPWLLAIVLRNQGRLREAAALAGAGTISQSGIRLTGHNIDVVTLAIVALESGQPRLAARRFLDMVVADRTSEDAVGMKARYLTWHMTLAGTALAADGDTAAVRALADSVERIGMQSQFGRDRKLHHFLRGLLLQHAGHHGDAVDAFRRSLHSSTDGYTRINLELARSLMALNRPQEAVAVLQPALRGGIDGANTYVTHTELHEALARAFERGGQRDSAAVHYAAVEQAWRKADVEFRARYAKAKSAITN